MDVFLPNETEVLRLCAQCTTIEEAYGVARTIRECDCGEERN